MSAQPGTEPMSPPGWLANPPADPNGKKSILAKMQAVMQEVERIGRDAYNENNKYAYASERAIKEAMHQALTTVGVVFQMSTSNPRVVRNENINASGNVTWTSVTWIDCTYRFWDVESGQFLEGTFLGSGSARDEKGHYAAITGAIKYTLTTAFLVPTGDDPEASDDTAQQTNTLARGKAQPKGKQQQRAPQEDGERQASDAKPASEKQRALVMKLIREKKGLDKDQPDAVRAAIGSILKREIASSKELTSADASKCIKHLMELPKYEDAVRKAQDDAAEKPESDDTPCPFCEHVHDQSEDCIECGECETVHAGACDTEEPNPAPPKGRATGAQERTTPPVAGNVTAAAGAPPPTDADAKRKQKLRDDLVHAAHLRGLMVETDVHLNGGLARAMGKRDGLYMPTSFSEAEQVKLTALLNQRA